MQGDDPKELIIDPNEIEQHPPYFFERRAEFSQLHDRLGSRVPLRHIPCFEKHGYTEYLEEGEDHLLTCPQCKRTLPMSYGFVWFNEFYKDKK